VVIYSGYYGGYGNLIKIRHENGDVTYYSHNSKNLVGVGDVVQQGQRIAEMGRTLARPTMCILKSDPLGASRGFRKTIWP
jgi:murein DD-endopeptidase MepM/ murein hydrolase activator NlpD